MAQTQKVSRWSSFFSGIRFRLMMWFSLVLAVVLVLFSVFIYSRQAQDLHDAAINRLALKTQQLEGVLHFEGLRSMQDLGLLISGLASGGVSVVQEDEVLVVIDPSGAWYARLGPVSDEDIARMVTTANQVVRGGQAQMVNFSIIGTTSDHDHAYLFLITPLSTRGGVAGYLLLGRPADPNGQLPSLAVTLIVAVLVILAGTGAAGYWMAGRILRPVKVITRAAQEISETDLNRRLNLTSRDELGQLANTLDGMLARLQAAFERQRQFTADASHELRTPLTIIGLETGRALESRRPPAEYEHTLKVIQGENEHMTRLVTDLLTLARMDSGQSHLNMEPLDLSEVAIEVVERLAPLAAERGVHLEAGELPETPVRGDRAALAQLARNLVENAVKYVAHGTGRVKVSTGRQADGQGWLRVEDNGPGIAPDDLAHLFERFYRVDKARARESGEGDPGGSGLGLAIVQGIVKAHAGELRVESQLGRGTTFIVNLK